MNKMLNDSMRRVSRSGIALLAAVMMPLPLVSTACMDDAVDETAAEVAEAALTREADGADKKTQADLSGDCSVHGDGRLYCGNDYFAPIYAGPFLNSGVVDHMLTTYSWFECWVHGDPHFGGNDTWYATQGDEHGNYGFMPAGYVYTSPRFDENPSRYGLRNCFN